MNSCIPLQILFRDGNQNSVMLMHYKVVKISSNFWSFNIKVTHGQMPQTCRACIHMNQKQQYTGKSDSISPTHLQKKVVGGIFQENAN